MLLTMARRPFFTSFSWLAAESSLAGSNGYQSRKPDCTTESHSFRPCCSCPMLHLEDRLLQPLHVQVDSHGKVVLMHWHVPQPFVKAKGGASYPWSWAMTAVLRFKTGLISHSHVKVVSSERDCNDGCSPEGAYKAAV